MLKLVIKRSRWLRGEEDSSLLRTKHNKMCCLGFLARACGYATNDIRGLVEPADVIDSSQFPAGLVRDTELEKENTRVCINLITINDNRFIDDKEREAKLKREFRSINILAKFVD